MQKIGITVPCYNEAARLYTAAFKEFVDREDWVFCFVNDSSKDGTSALLEDLLSAKPENIIVLNSPRNMGKAESVRAGVNELLKNEKLEFIGYLDADLSAPLDTVKLLAEKLAEFCEVQMIMASRVKMLGFDIRRSKIRHYLGRVYATLVSLILRIESYDTQCGCKLFRRAHLSRIFAEKFKTCWGFDAEIIMRYREILRGNPENYINEFPAPEWADEKGSKLGFIQMAGMLFGLVKLFMLSRKIERKSN